MVTRHSSSRQNACITMLPWCHNTSLWSHKLHDVTKLVLLSYHDATMLHCDVRVSWCHNAWITVLPRHNNTWLWSHNLQDDTMLVSQCYPDVTIFIIFMMSQRLCYIPIMMTPCYIVMWESSWHPNACITVLPWWHNASLWCHNLIAVIMLVSQCYPDITMLLCVLTMFMISQHCITRLL